MLLFSEAETQLEAISTHSGQLKEVICRWGPIIAKRLLPTKPRHVRNVKDGMLHSAYAASLWKTGKVKKVLRRRNESWNRCFIHNFSEPSNL